MRYNTFHTGLVTEEEAPKTWNELLDSKWNDQIVMSDPGSAGTTKYWMNAMMCSDKYGTDFMQKLKDNGCYLESGTTATHNQLAASAYKVGVCLDYVTANLSAEGSPIAFLYPEDTISIPSPIGLVADCKNEENGKLLYDFILSKEGQEILVANNLISVRNDVEQAADVATMAAKAMECDLATILAAKAGDSEAISSILKHYAAYISKHSKRPFFDEYGNRYELVDEEICQRIEAKLIYQIINRFDPFQYPDKGS